MVKTDENPHHQGRCNPHEGELRGAEGFDKKRPASRFKLIERENNEKKIKR